MPSPTSPYFLQRILGLGTLLVTSKEIDSASTGNPFARITPSTSLQWTQCFADTEKPSFHSVDCARLIVPLDYSDPSSGEAQLAIVRLNSKSKRSTEDEDGPIFFNPGGPGGDPIGDLVTGRAADVWANYAPSSDIIAIVPRGVGATLPAVPCYRDQSVRKRRLRALAMTNELGYTNASVDIMEANAMGFGIDCADVSAEVLPHMGTVSTARDIEYVLKKLGRKKLRFVGFSYGTVLGTTFAALFPDKIDRMVLDGVQDSNEWYSHGGAPDRAIGDVDAALDSFFSACFEAGPDACAIWRSGATSEIRAYFFEADRRIQQHPINVPQTGLFEFPQWRYAVYGALFQPSLLFQDLARLASEVYENTPGDTIAEILEAQATSGLPKIPSLVEPETGLFNGIESLWSIDCLDRGVLSSPAVARTSRRVFEEYRAVSEIGRNYAYYDIICKNFPIRSKAKLPGRFEDVQTSGSVLFVGSTADPTTPLRNAVSMAKAFARSAVLVINATGHSSQFADPSQDCVRQWIAPFMAGGSLPSNGTVCQGNQTPFSG